MATNNTTGSIYPITGKLVESLEPYDMVLNGENAFDMAPSIEAIEEELERHALELDYLYDATFSSREIVSLAVQLQVKGVYTIPFVCFYIAFQYAMLRRTSVLYRIMRFDNWLSQFRGLSVEARERENDRRQDQAYRRQEQAYLLHEMAVYDLRWYEHSGDPDDDPPEEEERTLRLMAHTHSSHRRSKKTVHEEKKKQACKKAVREDPSTKSVAVTPQSNQFHRKSNQFHRKSHQSRKSHRRMFCDESHWD